MRISETITAANPVEEYRLSLRNVPVFGLRPAYVKLKRAANTRTSTGLSFPCRPSLQPWPMPNAVSSVRTGFASRKRLGRSRTPSAERYPVVMGSWTCASPSASAPSSWRKGLCQGRRSVDHLEFAHLAKSRKLPAGLGISGQLTRSGRRSPSASTAAGSRPS